MLSNTPGKNLPKIALLITLSQKRLSILPRILEQISPDITFRLESIYVVAEAKSEAVREVAQGILKTYDWQKIKFLAINHHYKGKGYGKRQKIGFEYILETHCDYVIIFDADRYDSAITYLPLLINQAQKINKKLIIASFSKINRKTLLSKLLKWLLLKPFAHLFKSSTNKISIWDAYSGFRLYSTDVVRYLPFASNTDGFYFDVHMMMQCKTIGAEIDKILLPSSHDKAHEVEERNLINYLKYLAYFELCTLSYLLHNLHIRRQTRYIVEPPVTYTLKKSPYSSHGQIAKLIPAHTSILDVGCGTGFLGELFQGKNVKMSGIDCLPSNQVSKNLEKYYQADLEYAEKLKLDWQYQCIILGDIVEHIRDDVDLLKWAKKYLTPDGRLIISTANIAIWFYRLSLLIGRFEYGQRGILDKTHVKLYTLVSFQKLIENAGYRIIKVHTTSLPFELVLPSLKDSLGIKFITYLYYLLTRLWPTLFAYQFVIEAEIGTIEIMQASK